MDVECVFGVNLRKLSSVLLRVFGYVCGQKVGEIRNKRMLPLYWWQTCVCVAWGDNANCLLMLVKIFKCKCFLKIVTVISVILHLKSNQLWIERTHMTIRMLSRLTLRKMRRMVASDTDCYGSTFVCMSFLISTLCVLCLLSAYYCRVCSGYVMMGNDGTRTLKLAHSWEAVPFRKLIFCLPLAIIKCTYNETSLPLSVDSTNSIPPYLARASL